MSFRSSLKKFRPILERCESRDLAAAGIGSLFAHAAPAVATPALDKRVFADVYNKTGKTVQVKWDVKYYNPDTKRWDSITKVEGLGTGKYTLDRTYRSVDPVPQLSISYDTVPGGSTLDTTQGLANGATYNFVYVKQTNTIALVKV